MQFCSNWQQSCRSYGRSASRSHQWLKWCPNCRWIVSLQKPDLTMNHNTKFVLCILIQISAVIEDMRCLFIGLDFPGEESGKWDSCCVWRRSLRPATTVNLEYWLSEMASYPCFHRHVRISFPRWSSCQPCRIFNFASIALKERPYDMAFRVQPLSLGISQNNPDTKFHLWESLISNSEP